LGDTRDARRWARYGYCPPLLLKLRQSRDWPNPKDFQYTFDRIATVTDHFTQALGQQRYTLYMQDYGGPVGFRLALAHPERIQSLIVQNAVAHNEGLGEIWTGGHPERPVL
jgi:pimeloyl-ACP methyl ester carboxylesterase